MASLGWLLNLGFGGSAETAIELGATSQLGVVTSTGGITRERNLGATSQLGGYSSTGGITLEIALGGTSQIAAFSASGVIQVGEQVEEETATGGYFWWLKYEQEQLRRRDERERRKRLKENAARIEDELERDLAIELQKDEEERERVEELKRLTDLVEEHKQDIIENTNEKVIKAAERAIIQGNFSAMEALERELARLKEEEDFLMQAVQLLVA